MSNKKFKRGKAFQYDHWEDDATIIFRHCDENHCPRKSECQSLFTVLSKF